MATIVIEIRKKQMSHIAQYVEVCLGSESTTFELFILNKEFDCFEMFILIKITISYI